MIPGAGQDMVMKGWKCQGEYEVMTVWNLA